MKKSEYAIEGRLIETAENKMYLSSYENIMKAYKNEVILEADAVMCDHEMNIIVDLNGVRGIIPKDEALYFRQGQKIKDIAVITRVGKPVCFRITSFNYDSKGNPVAILSRREVQKDCTDNYLMKLSVGDIIPAKITHMEQFGVFCDIGCGVVSLMPIDAISVSRISHPADRFKENQDIYAVIKSIDYESGRIYLSHKELLGTWEENVSRFEIGQTVTGTVRSIEEYGIFVELMPNLAGLAEYKENVCVGDVAAVYIKNIIPDRMKIKLVLIDNRQSREEHTGIKYFIDPEKTKHITSWRYSPQLCTRTIESEFG